MIHIDDRFFRVLLPGFSKKLALPNSFCERLGEERTKEKTATLVGSNGKVWNVDLIHKEKTRQVWMGGQGWKEFVDGNELQLGFVLIMRHKGKMVFKFRVFDLSTCEQIKPSAIAALGKRKRIDYQSDQDQNTLIDDSDSVQNTECRYKKRKLEMPESSSPSENGSDSIDTNPHFDVTVKAYVFVAHILTIPDKFGRACGITYHKEVTVFDPDGRKWPIGLNHTVRYVRFSKGWSLFVRSNSIKVGDRIRFELISPADGKNKRARIQMTKRAQSCTFGAQSKRRTAINDSENEDIISSANSITEPTRTSYEGLDSSSTASRKKSKAWNSKPESLKSHFEATINESNLIHNCLRIPTEFTRSVGLSGEQKEIIIKDPKGKSWRLGLLHLNHSTQISRGWPKFARCNELSEGNRLRFDLVYSQGEDGLYVNLKMRKLRC